MADNMGTAALRSYVGRIERLEEERAEIAADIRETYAEAKAGGFDTKTIKRVVRERRIDANVREEQLSMFTMYWDAVHGVNQPDETTGGAETPPETDAQAQDPAGPEPEAAEPAPPAAKEEVFTPPETRPPEKPHGIVWPEPRDGAPSLPAPKGAVVREKDANDIPEHLRRAQ